MKVTWDSIFFCCNVKKWKQAIDKGEYVSVQFLQLSKVFDTYKFYFQKTPEVSNF